MKTKLLKKVRKRYKIMKVDSLAKNSGDLLQYYKVRFGLPFYILKDKKSRRQSIFSSTYSYQYDNLCHWIRQDYEYLKETDKETVTKVWY